MNEPRKKNSTLGIGVFFVVVVLLVIGTVLFNAIRSNRAYEEANPLPAASAAASDPAVAAPASASDSAQ
jgi:predicted lipid-binding transport protein (Tim44 family)